MIESIQFSEGVLSFTIALPGRSTASERERSVKFYFGEGGAIAELHRGELVDFLYSIDFESPYKVTDLIFELLGTHARVRGVHFHCFYGASERLEGGTATDEQIKLARGTV